MNNFIFNNQDGVLKHKESESEDQSEYQTAMSKLNKAPQLYLNHIKMFDTTSKRGVRRTFKKGEGMEFAIGRALMRKHSKQSKRFYDLRDVIIDENISGMQHGLLELSKQNFKKFKKNRLKKLDSVSI